MKKLLRIVLILSILLSACGTKTDAAAPSAEPTVVPSEVPTETQVPSECLTELPTESSTEPAVEVPTQPPHSALYIPGVDVEEVIRYFAEVCLDAEISHSGNASVVQKWEDPVRYLLMGDCTVEDLATLKGFESWINTVEGFPGMEQAREPNEANLRIHFCSPEEMTILMGPDFQDMDGAVTFWYNDRDEIYDAIICCRTDLDQHLRNSVIQEELYNSLGPIQDTDLREDSIIYSGYSEPQNLTQMDELILKLLYHPQIHCRMTAAQCSEVIRQLYY